MEIVSQLFTIAIIITIKSFYFFSTSEKTAASSKSPVISPRITNSVPRVGLTGLDDPRLKLVPRSYRALYDYLPATMSPNKDSVSEELTFHSGDIIDVYGGVDADGFFLGQVSQYSYTCIGIA